jgi:hypothetical protein
LLIRPRVLVPEEPSLWTGSPPRGRTSPISIQSPPTYSVLTVSPPAKEAPTDESLVASTHPADTTLDASTTDADTVLRALESRERQLVRARKAMEEARRVESEAEVRAKERARRAEYARLGLSHVMGFDRVEEEEPRALPVAGARGVLALRDTHRQRDDDTSPSKDDFVQRNVDLAGYSTQRGVRLTTEEQRRIALLVGHDEEEEEEMMPSVVAEEGHQPAACKSSPSRLREWREALLAKREALHVSAADRERKELELSINSFEPSIDEAVRLEHLRLRLETMIKEGFAAESTQHRASHTFMTEAEPVGSARFPFELSSQQTQSIRRLEQIDASLSVASQGSPRRVSRRDIAIEAAKCREALRRRCHPGVDGEGDDLELGEEERRLLHEQIVDLVESARRDPLVGSTILVDSDDDDSDDDDD